ncbi:MAG: sugar phosphate isomerase/epimerase [Gorillibacterium sp.]|nr:sugar phosphate isomerase/epimerase [Gorillibacterium sp.]
MRRMGIGLQMYSLRNETAGDFRGVLRKVSKLGYEGVEFAGYGDVPAEEMKALLQELKITAIGGHVRYPNLKERLEQEITYLKTIGASYIVCPNIPLEERKDWHRLFEFLKSVAQEAQSQGLQFAYHNHDFEFEEKVGAEFVFDALYQSLPASLATAEMDIGWVQFIGQDPLAYIKKYSGRLPLLHLKDFQHATDGSIDTLELGAGLVDLPEVIRAASDAGTQWLIVEQDKCHKPPLECIETSIQWLRENYCPHLKA